MTVLRNSFQQPQFKQSKEEVKPPLKVVAINSAEVARKARQEDVEKARMILLGIKLQLSNMPEDSVS